MTEKSNELILTLSLKKYLSWILLSIVLIAIAIFIGKSVILEENFDSINLARH